MSGVNTIWCATTAITARTPSLSGVDSAVLTAAAQQASDMLYAMSGRRYPGQGRMVVRPQARPSSMTIRDWTQYLQTLSGFSAGTSWVNGGGWFGNYNDSPSTVQIDLGAYPIRAVNVVKIDGVIIPANEYRVDDFRYLVRTLTTASAQPTDRPGWPRNQNMMLPDTEPGTFSVDFNFGEDPPQGGVSAAVTLATEFVKMYTAQPNRLPSRVQSITRQGVSFAILDPMQFLDEGLTGLYDVDLWIRSVNPGKQRFPATVWSPDLGTTRRAGTTYP